MIHHVSIGTNDAARARRFYDAVLPILGLRAMPGGDGLDYGTGQTEFSIEEPADGQPATVGNGVHIAFAAEDRATVDRFYAAALRNGGSGAGEPGLRPDYDANYYAAFVRDPDGNKIQAVTFSAQ